MLDKYRPVVVMPTYNNANTLGTVLEGVLRQGLPVVVVNDGATDTTPEVLRRYPNVKVLAYSPNRGKGYALNRGMEWAADQGYTHAVSIDSDGQHYPDDIVKLVEASRLAPDTLLVGARSFEAENMPAKNSFGNRFSNFWYLAATGERLADSQSGFRVYPLHCMRRPFIHWPRYEGELEVLVKSQWRGLPVRSIPVRVYYAPPSERVSHFRPWRDVMRISALNWTLIPQALLFRRALTALRRTVRKGWRQFVREDVLRIGESNARASAAIALGVGFGLSPLWGFQGVAALAVAYVVRLNKFTTFVATNISLPPAIPFILWAGYALGGVLLGKGVTLPFGEVNAQTIALGIGQYLLGSILLAIGCGLLTWGIVYTLLSIFHPAHQEERSNG